MKLIISLLFFSLVMEINAQVVYEVAPIDSDTLDFAMEDLDASMAKAKKERKYLFLDFWADWCLPCKQMDRLTFSDSLMKVHLRENYILHRVDVAQFTGMDIAEKYKTEKYPTMIIFDRKGNELGRMTGYRSAAVLLEELKAIEDKGKR